MKLKKRARFFVLFLLVSLFVYVIFLPALGNTGPVVQSSPSLEAWIDHAYLYQIKVSGSDLSYHLIQSPNGMTIDESSGLIQWIPNKTQLGENEVKIEVINHRFLKVLTLLSSLKTENGPQITANVTQEFSIEVYSKITPKVDSNEDKKNKEEDCSEEESNAGLSSFFASIFGGG